MSAFPTEPALEAAVVAHADEDTPRLVYADWLDENGDPDRAAFIRVQCRLADLPPDDPDWCRLDVQEDVLAHRLTPYLAELCPPLPLPYSHGTYAAHIILKKHFRRGFPSRAFYCGSFPRPQLAVANFAELVATTTYRDVELQSLPPEWVERLAESPAVGHLRGLALTFDYGWSPTADIDRGAAFLKLTASPVARNLQRLGLAALPLIARTAIAESGGFPALRRLDAPGWAVFGAVLAAPWMRGLRHLWVRESGTSFGDPAIAAAGELPDLHTLELNARADLAVLAAARFPRLVRFVRSGVPLLLRDFQPLFTAPWLAQLHSLDVANSDLGDRAIVALAKYPVARNLRDLRLGNNPFGKMGLNALAEPGAFPELVRLDLALVYAQKRKATESDVTAFLRRLTCPKLQSLHLTGLPMGDDGARAIADNPNLSGLRELRLGEGVTDRGREMLKAAEHLRQTAII